MGCKGFCTFKKHKQIDFESFTCAFIRNIIEFYALFNYKRDVVYDKKAFGELHIVIIIRYFVQKYLVSKILELKTIREKGIHIRSNPSEIEQPGYDHNTDNIGM